MRAGPFIHHGEDQTRTVPRQAGAARLSRLAAEDGPGLSAQWSFSWDLHCTFPGVLRSELLLKNQSFFLSPVLQNIVKINQ